MITVREAPPGFEPGNKGFAIPRLRPLGYGAVNGVIGQPISWNLAKVTQILISA